MLPAAQGGQRQLGAVAQPLIGVLAFEEVVATELGDEALDLRRLGIDAGARRRSRGERNECPDGEVTGHGGVPLPACGLASAPALKLTRKREERALDATGSIHFPPSSLRLA